MIPSGVQLWRVVCALFLFVTPALAQETVGTSVGAFLTSPPVEATLLVIGGVFLLLSVLTMGSAVAEVCCFLTFTLLFAGRYLNGDDPWLPLGLLVVGVGFLLAEVFVIPGFGVAGILGLGSLGAMTVLIMESPTTGLIIFFLTTILSVAAGFLAIRLMPNLCLTRKLFILPVPERSEPPRPPTPDYLPMVGDAGEAATTLRPGGYALFGSHRVDVSSENEFISKGQSVEVVRIEGSRVIVRSTPTPSGPEI